MPRDYADIENDLYKILRDNKNKLLKQIKNYKEEKDFKIDDAENAILHSWSILARFEEEYENTKSDEEMMEAIRNFDDERSHGNISVEKYIGLLQSSIERLTNRANRVKILSSMQKSNRLLGQQMLENQKIKESMAKQHYMEITEHAQILAAFGDIVFLAMRRLGLDEATVRGLAREIKKIQRDYPLVKMDLDSIYRRLYGEPEEVNAEYSLIEAPSTDDDEDYRVIKDL